ncbi:MULTISPECIES: alpha-L-fucosidase [unclassified Dysgonomonas]|jgi:alpha-L-fucosidase|uniref:alpha-L-fucosidase n=1 Tax=unclassified Dysgonomonas TaxID=2630389 RepID=UPI0025C44EEC|nr:MULTISPECIES: alpha-L-fucosidase [unclassified Dysgonomonas]MDR2004418.1 alpha-L-fucosidase [Prevotella sp.]HMM04110.1 alpha-L-fucosidase [Dysgonomonas sp.]
MKKVLFSLLLILFIIPRMNSQTTPQKPDTKWFEDARFGMFVHFGPYSVLGAGEWVMNTRPVKGKDYMRLQTLFNPQAFDAKEWVRIAKGAGMKYITFTSRHHDGFSNWDTKQSDWNIMNTPYGKDLIKQLADECKKQDMKLVLYYSLLDWMRTDYQYETGRTGKAAGRTEKSDWQSYINFMKAQLTELLTNYEIAGIWFDGHWDQTEDENRTDHTTHVDWHYPEIYELIHTLRPGCLVANNHHLPPFAGEDYQIFERDVPGENKSGYSGQEVSRLPLETCETINGAWGFNITDDKFKSTKDLLHLLIRTAGTGANLLLNVGPMPNGQIQPECVQRLQEMGEWMDSYGYTIYGTQQGFVKPQAWGAVTKNGKTYYIHILDKDTKSITLNIPDIKSAKWINLQAQPEWKKDKKTGDVTFTLTGELDETDSIIEVMLK